MVVTSITPTTVPVFVQDDLFLRAAEDIRKIELAEPGEEPVQGIPCAVATASDGSTHGVMFPVSGKVLEVSEDVRSKPMVVETGPNFNGWLYRALPSDSEGNLQWLSL